MIGTIRSRVGFFFRPFRNNGRPAYLNTPPMTEAKKIAAAGQKQSGNNFFSQSNAASSSRPAKLTARIEFGGPQFLLRGVDGNAQSITPASTPVAANINARPDPHLERRRERLRRAFPDADIDGSESKTRSR